MKVVLTDRSEAVFRAIDFDIWATTFEIAGRAFPGTSQHRNVQVAAILNDLVRKGLVDKRISDAHGHAEWAMTDEGIARAEAWTEGRS